MIKDLFNLIKKDPSPETNPENQALYGIICFSIKGRGAGITLGKFSFNIWDKPVLIFALKLPIFWIPL